MLTQGFRNQASNATEHKKLVAGNDGIVKNWREQSLFSTLHRLCLLDF